MRLGVMIGAERGDMARKVKKLLDDIEWAEAMSSGTLNRSTGAARPRGAAGAGRSKLPITQRVLGKHASPPAIVSSLRQSSADFRRCATVVK